jgi:hypothetical protein
MILWRWPLDYYLLPAHWIASILLPVSVWFWLSKSYGIWITYLKKFILILLLVSWVVFITMRGVSGFLIFQQDALKDDLVATLVEQEWNNKRFILPFNHPNSAEVGERIKWFANRKNISTGELNLFNFWELDSEKIKNIDRFKDSVGLAPERGQLLLASQTDNPYLIWRFGKSFFNGKPTIWGMDNLRPNDIILFPYGENLPGWLHARGLGMYSPNLYKPDNINVAEVNLISRSIGNYTIGWKFYRVLDINKIDIK